MNRSIGIASLIWGVGILLSRIAGLAREVVIGRTLGPHGEADLYFAAFILPDWLNYLLAGGVLTLVFIPIFQRHLADTDEDAAWDAFSVVGSFAAVLMAVATVVLWWATPWLVETVVAPGKSAADHAVLTDLVRIILPAQIFHVLGGLLSAALQARDKHTLPALAPLVYTGGIIVGGLITGSAEGFAWGVLVGSALGPFLLPLIGSVQAGLRYRPRLDPRNPDLRRYLWRSLPIMLGFSIVVVDDWIITREASGMGEGAVATLRYAKNLMRVPMGVFGLATGVAAYPTISRMVARGEHAQAYQTLSGAVRAMLVMAFGAQVVLTVAGADISAVIYGDRISAEGHAAIGHALAILCLGLWAWAAQTVVARGFYARGETWLPTLAGSAAAFGCYPLYHALGQELGLLGLPIATTVAISAYVSVLVVLLRRRHPGVSDGYGPFLVRVVPAAVLAVGVGLGLDHLVALPHPLLQGGLTGGVAGGVFLASVLALKVPEARVVVDKVVARVRRGRR